MQTITHIKEIMVPISRVDKRTKEGKNYELLKRDFGNTHTVRPYKVGEYSFYAKISLSDLVWSSVTTLKYVNATERVVDVPTECIVNLYSMQLMEGSKYFHYVKDEELVEREVTARMYIDTQTFMSIHQMEATLLRVTEDEKIEKMREQAKIDALNVPMREIDNRKLKNSTRAFEKLFKVTEEVTIKCESRHDLERTLGMVKDRYIKSATASMLSLFNEILKDRVRYITDDVAKRYTFEEAFYETMEQYKFVVREEHGGEIVRMFIDAINFGW